MKAVLKIFGIIIVVGVLLVSCVVRENNGRNLPPGKAKKGHGKSARHHAPRQNKKEVYDYNKHPKKHKPHKGHKRGKH